MYGFNTLYCRIEMEAVSKYSGTYLNSEQVSWKARWNESNDFTKKETSGFLYIKAMSGIVLLD